MQRVGVAFFTAKSGILYFLIHLGGMIGVDVLKQPEAEGINDR